MPSLPSAKTNLGADVRAAIEKIHEENEALKQDLARESRQARLTQVMNSSQGGVVQRLQAEADLFLRRIDGERRKIASLDGKIAACQKEIIEQRQKMGGINASKENADMITKQIRLLEKRLDKALQRFNESLAQNKQLREHIDDLRKERVVFDGIYKKLERDLHDKKKDMAAIIEDSKLAYQRSDKARADMRALKERVDKEKSDFESEWADLGRLMEQDRQLREQLRRKEREAHDAADPRLLRLQNGAPEEQLALDDSRAGSADDGAPGPAKPRAPALTADQVRGYQETFEKIQAATGVESMEALVENFQDIEQKNFSLFNSINELNSDIETSELAIAETKLEIEKYKGQGVSTDTQRKKVLRDLEEKLEKTTSKADEYEAKHAAATKTIGQLKTGIHSIFSRLGCNSSSVEEMLGNQGVTESNMMQYLEIIESRTTEILQTYAASQSEMPEDPEDQGTGRIGSVQPPAARLSVQPPAWDDFSSGDEAADDDDERPLTREELQRKTLRGLEAKAKAAALAKATAHKK